MFSVCVILDDDDDIMMLCHIIVTGRPSLTLNTALVSSPNCDYPLTFLISVFDLSLGQPWVVSKQPRPPPSPRGSRR